MRCNQKIRDAVRAAVACGMATGFMFAGSAIAAQQNQNTSTGTVTNSEANSTSLKAVEVTGTRIKRTSVEQAQPIVIVTQAQIKATGLTTVGQVLQTLSSAGSQLNLTNNNGGGDTEGAAGRVTLNLRNLGASRVLILVNGHRWATGLNGTVDLDTIPSSIIDHVEVLQDGASAIYGSDAISGVVNIITVKNFNGAKASAYVGSYHGDGFWDGLTKNDSVTIGTSNARAGILFNASYQDTNGVPSVDRKSTRVVIAGTGTTRGSSGTPQGRYRFIAPYGGSTTSPDNFPLSSTGLTATQCPAKQYGTLNKPNYLPTCDLTTIKGTPGTSPSDFRPFLPTDQYNYATSNWVLTPDQRFNVYSAGHFDIADNLTASVEAMFQQRHSSERAAPEPLFIGLGGSSATANLAANYPFNPFGFELNTNAPLGPGLLVSAGRRLVENGPRLNIQDSNLVHARAGLSGFFDLGASEWDWDAGYAFSDDTSIDTLNGKVDYSRLSLQLSDATACAEQAAQRCGPFDLFGGQTAQITPQQFAYSIYLDKYQINRKTHTIYADISNDDVAELPAGPIGLAAGYQFIGKTGFYHPSSTQAQQAFPILPTNGKIVTTAAYVEADFPLLADVPFAKLVDLDVASRRTEVKISNVARYNTSSRAGLKWQPTADLLIRGTWSQGFRAPSISDSFAGGGFGQEQANDPCDNYLTSGVPASVQNLCRSEGVPPSYVQSLGQIASISGGNSKLRPETSISRTVGFVYSPDWLPGFNMNMDYYKIELQHSIQGVGVQTILNGCYLQDNGSYCDRVIRQNNGTGDILNINDSLTNIGGTLTSGVDLGFSYDFPMSSVGQFKLSLQSSYVREFNLIFPTSTGGVTVTRLAGLENAGGNNEGVPRWKAFATLGWNLANWGATWRVQLIGPMWEHCSDYLDGTPQSFTNFGLCSEPNYQNNTLSMNRMPTSVYNNVQVHYLIDAWNTTVSFGINNVFDKEPPWDPVALNSFDGSIYPIPGRFYYASIGVNF